MKMFNQILLPALFTSMFASILVGCDSGTTVDPQQQYGSDPKLPTPQNFILPPVNVPKGTGWKENQSPTVAKGLKIEKIAAQLEHPRSLLTLPNGDILVVEGNSPGSEALTAPKQIVAGKVIKGQSGKGGKGGNRITLLRLDEASHWNKYNFLDNLNSPFGVQLIGNNLYVSNTNNIMKYAYQTGATQITDQGVELADLPDRVNHHWTKALLASPDGSKLYVGVGSNSNITENGEAVEYRRANILEVDTQTGASRIYASGLRNPTGLQWERKSAKLWAIVNERDEIGQSLVPDYMTSVQDKGFYGWPYSYYGQHVDTRVKPERPDLVAKAIKPDYSLGAHVAPLGLLFTSDNINLTSQYKDGAFVSNHGSWGKKNPVGYNVVFIPFKDGKPNGKPVTVVDGFYSKEKNESFGAPVGLTEDKTGALIIADDVGNSVWRVSVK
ncbi:PQQ-dependent sugar dehydrogenase [Acinetobacter shaoyimingii]|uniref:Sorbosone dehydrogenase family protein n=1 Tax=Acinetobacter shaoyimingii TaxID=2715164 RepID=A0A6G8RVF7_9GAMM|nr:sorbosone dehydrogenase family protein [Acinetobacter shaoyimingii]